MKVALLATEIEGVVAPVLHNKVPVTPVAVSTEAPQLFATETPGAGRFDFGAAIPVAIGLKQPLAPVTVTV